MQGISLVILLSLVEFVSAWVPSKCGASFYRYSLKMSSSEFSSSKSTQSSRLDQELDTFFETASKSGSKTILKLTPEERAEMTVRGAAIEDLIYEARDRLLELEDLYMREPDPTLLEEITILRDEISGLKDDYIQLVGAKDLPLYFGKPMQ